MVDMCGRYTLRSKPLDIAAAFDVVDVPDELTPRYNVAPTQRVAAVVFDPRDRQRRLRMFSWGLVPSWADDPAIGNRMLNARAETIAEKPSFRTAFKQRRCLVLADGFYEWKREGKLKQPFHIRRSDGRPFGMAGLHEHWHRDGLTVDSCTIITTTANELMQPLHERMPVILDSVDYARWLDPAFAETATLAAMLVPAAADDWEAVPVSTIVNNARNETPECLQPADR